MNLRPLLHTFALATGLATTALHAASQFDLIQGEAGKTDPQHDKVNSTWKLVWADEFNGTSLDMSKWQFEVNGKGGGNNERQYYTDRKENAKVAGGNLVINAIKEKYTGPDGKRDYTSSRIKTKGKGDWLYGRMEARIKLPEGGKGIWPAFWMMPTDEKYGGWARSGEIDIMENVGHQPSTLYGTLHYGDSWPKNKHTGDKLELTSGKLGDAFHVYAVEWEPGVMRWYFDGKRYQTQTKWDTKAAPFPAPFDQRFFIIFNLAVGGQWPGDPAPSTKFPQQMLVDYVRVYQPAGGFPKSAAPAAAAPAPAPEPAAAAVPPPAPEPQAEAPAPAAQPAAPKAAKTKQTGPWYSAGEFQETKDSQETPAEGEAAESEPTPEPEPVMNPAGSSW
jgi:beta-glucanase (GH16 family)